MNKTKSFGAKSSITDDYIIISLSIEKELAK